MAISSWRTQTGAVISYGAGVQVDYAIDALEDGDRLSLGDVSLEIIATPGHTPESISIIVFEHDADAVPYGVLTGDTLFIGDVGRPDLLTTAGSGLTGDVLGRQLYHSLHDKLLALPDVDARLSRPRRRLGVRQAAVDRDLLDAG